MKNEHRVTRAAEMRCGEINRTLRNACGMHVSETREKSLRARETMLGMKCARDDLGTSIVAIEARLSYQDA